MRTASPEPWIEWLSRKILWLAVGGLELLWLHAIGPLFRGIGQMIVFTIKTIINHTSKYVIIAVVALAFITALVWLWQMEFDFLLFIETIKNLWL